MRQSINGCYAALTQCIGLSQSNDMPSVNMGVYRHVVQASEWREKGEERREKGEGRREKGEGRREKGEGRREKGEGRREKGEARSEK